MEDTMRTNREKLLAVMERDGLSIADVAAMTGAAEVTVKGWLRPAGNKAHREVSDTVLRILDLALGARVVSSHAEAAGVLGIGIADVKRQVADAMVLVRGALWSEQTKDGGGLLGQVAGGGTVEVVFGPVRAIVSPSWTFVPVANAAGHTVLVGVLAHVVEGGIDVDRMLMLAAETDSWPKPICDGYGARQNAEAALAHSRIREDVEFRLRRQQIEFDRVRRAKEAASGRTAA
jgi:hypothetical protein